MPIDRLAAHLERTLAAPDRLGALSVIRAAPDRPYVTLITAGMSDLPMNVPDTVDDAASWRHAELCMVLPPDWPLEPSSWPLRLLESLAGLPRGHDTWLGWGHSIPNGDPAQPYAPDTQLAGAIIVPPYALPDDFFVVEGEPPIHIFQVVPVTALEMGFKLALGVDALIEKLEEAHPAIFGPLDPTRASAV